MVVSMSFCEGTDSLLMSTYGHCYDMMNPIYRLAQVPQYISQPLFYLAVCHCAAATFDTNPARKRHDLPHFFPCSNRSVTLSQSKPHTPVTRRTVSSHTIPSRLQTNHLVSDSSTRTLRKLPPHQIPHAQPLTSLDPLSHVLVLNGLFLSTAKQARRSNVESALRLFERMYGFVNGGLRRHAEGAVDGDDGVNAALGLQRLIRIWTADL
jgi:hypothetical protein